ncbi:MAG: hypothetical protein ABI759_01600 [Candidatus Solibacter sp.]
MGGLLRQGPSHGKEQRQPPDRVARKVGAEYFHIAQITRISSADYRAVAPAISARGIESNGEIIPLKPENSQRIAAAVESLRRAVDGTAEATPRDPLSDLEAAGDRLLKQFQALSHSRGRSDPNVASSVFCLRTKIDRLLSEVK